jgi:DNA-binding NarL/FixJ family response regulator
MHVRTLALEPPRRRLVAAMLSAALALGLSLAMITTAGAQTDAQTTEELDAPPAVAPTPGWGVIERLASAGLLPEHARSVFQRALLEHADVQHPGVSCERILAAANAPEHLVERCHAAAVTADGERPDRSEACRRAAHVAAPVSALVERCREWLANSSTAPQPVNPAEACRRIAAADDPPAEWVERCRAWLASQSDDGHHPTITAICRRIIASESSPAELVERCRAALAQEVERPERPERPGATRTS